ncbi:Armadillo-type fold domain containing protein [Dorcoceras hygrometricum]|uniref:Armadillo-type fold domain containing protein n=1 Tax=Dorcoceras hygrometricum TaxID=472368 RepID=A0A2Z7D8Y6_9LAMI|nr:Armadillo-type fold domain containing protein [Dorcoceras hygrometricum]
MSASSNFNSHQSQQIFMRHADVTISADSNSTSRSYKSHTQQYQVLRGLIKSVRQEVQIQKTALSLEILEFKKGVRAQNVIFTTYLADIRKEVQEQKAALSQEMDDKFKGVQDQQAALSHDIMEFRVKAQETLIPSPLSCQSLLIISIEVVMPKRGKVVAAEVRSLLLMVVADLVLVMEEADLAEVVGEDLRVKDITKVVDLTKDQEEALDTG